MQATIPEISLSPHRISYPSALKKSNLIHQGPNPNTLHKPKTHVISLPRSMGLFLEGVVKSRIVVVNGTPNRIGVISFIVGFDLFLCRGWLQILCRVLYTRFGLVTALCAYHGLVARYSYSDD